ncbi:integrase catalytic domain-containing protein [Trichonephila clavipes]|nr:integrase catalytic domain-containing protein [Trichonephila clavipes]
MNTYFGWTVMGRTGEACSANEVLLSLNVSDLKICDLWSLDSLEIKEPSISQSKSEIEEAVREHFVRSLRRDDEGLQKRNCLREYENIFKEWVSEKIIEPVEPEELAREKEHFLPHRPIFKENSTTRIRLVFDASAKERNSGSLNDCIEKGPNYLELIPKLLNRFRLGKYGVISDKRRAFLQIKVAPSDRKFLRFLWWEKGDPRKLIVHSHCRVVFGVNTSPFLLAAAINYHLENVAESQKGMAAKLKESYVCG